MIPRQFPATFPVARWLPGAYHKITQPATALDDLKVPPGNRLEKLKGDRVGQHSIRVNDQWRICLAWKGGDALDVEIVDYH
jgi:proteic killer suppression protein